MDKTPLLESFAWQVCTRAQRRILQWLDQRQPWAILYIRPYGAQGLIATDCYCLDHWLECRPDGEVVIIREEE